MARIPNDDYSSRVDSTDPNYSLGKAQNLIGGVEGTGTPVDAKWMNDDWGFKQAILKEADITPSGVSDHEDDSQYLDGLKTIITGFIKDIPTLALAIDDLKLTEGLLVRLAERTAGNGGGAIWEVIATGTTKWIDLPNGYTIVPHSIAGLSLRLRHRGTTLDLLKVGYVADGVTLNDEAINIAQRFMIDIYGGGELLYPLGVGMIGRGIRLDNLEYETGDHVGSVALNIKHSGVSKQGTVLRAATSINSIFSSFPEWGGFIVNEEIKGTGIEIRNMTLDCDYDNLQDGAAEYGLNYENFIGTFPDGSSAPSIFAADNYQYPIYTFVNQQVLVSNIRVINSWYNGIEIFKTTDMTVELCDVENCGDKENAFGFYTGIEMDNGCNNIRILNNNIKNVGYGIFSNGGDIITNLNPVKNINISGNTITNTSQDGISGFDWLDTWKIHDNIMNNIGKEAFSFIFVDPNASGNTEKHCQNFEIYDNTVNGFNLDNTVRTAIRFQGHNLKVYGNTIKNLDPLITSNTHGLILSDNVITIPTDDVSHCIIRDNAFIGIFAGDNQNVSILNIGVDGAVVVGNTLHSTGTQCQIAARVDADNVTFLRNDIKGTYQFGSGNRPNFYISGDNLIMDDVNYSPTFEVRTSSGEGGLSGLNTVDFDNNGLISADVRGLFVPASNSFTPDYPGRYRFTAKVTFGSSGSIGSPTTCTAFLEKNTTDTFGNSSGTSVGRLDIDCFADIDLNAGDTVRLRANGGNYTLETNCYMKVEWIGKQ